MKRFSVVIPYYKGADSIAEAVRSVISQSLRPDEIVICDDGSPDDLEAALGDLVGEVRIVRKENGGISSAMNATTAAARGEWLVQLDQDDVFLPGRLAAIAAAAEADPGADLIATDAVIEFDGEPLTTLAAVNPFQTKGQRSAILGSPYFLWPAIRRELLEKVGGYDESFPVMQDWECFIRLVLAGGRIAFIPEALYCWRLTPGSRSSSDGVENAEALIRMMRKILGDPNLRPEEYATAAAALAAHERRLLLERAHLALAEDQPNARRLSVAVATGKGFSPASRAKAAVATASPGLARRFVAAREERDPGVEALTRRGFRRPG
jgi:glycosyltransferase involved in cell wall biosynthesis